MKKRLSFWVGLVLWVVALAILGSAAEARTEKTLTKRTQLSPVNSREVLWFAPGQYWVDDASGGVQSGTLDETKALPVWNSKGKVEFGPGFIRFEASAGGVKEGMLAADTLLYVVNTAARSTLQATFKAKTAVEFGYDGNVMRGTLAKEATLKQETGGDKSFPAGAQVDFNGAG